jgi:hypothetical protein
MDTIEGGIPEETKQQSEASTGEEGMASPVERTDEHEQQESLTNAAEDVQVVKSTTKRLRIPAKYRNKKPADMPRRCLSAYNLFFKKCRAEIVAERAISKEPLPSTGLFESMAKTIASRWKNIAPEELQKFTLLAKEDSIRYRSEMEIYNRKAAEDKSMAAKGRRAERRKVKQQEKALQKATEGNAHGKTGIKDQSFHHNTTLSHLPTANFVMRMQSMDTNDNPAADFHMRLLASHAEGLGLAVPPSQPAPITDYIRQIMHPDSTDFARALQQHQSATLAAHSFQVQSNQDSSVPTSIPNSMPSNSQFGGPDALTMWQLLQQQHLARPSTGPTAALETEFDGLFALHQLTGAQQRQLNPASLDPSLGLLFQLQQEQQLRGAATLANAYKQNRQDNAGETQNYQPAWNQQGGGQPN